jgi:hypothetical protein
MINLAYFAGLLLAVGLLVLGVGLIRGDEILEGLPLSKLAEVKVTPLKTLEELCESPPGGGRP